MSSKVLAMLGVTIPPNIARTYEDRCTPTGSHTTKWSPHAQWARPAGQSLYRYFTRAF
jgi:hypothetical protein